MKEPLAYDERVTGFRVYADPPTLLHLEGELDVASAPAFTRALEAQIRRCNAIRLDFADLTFMDSTGIGAICNAARLLGDRGRIVAFNVPRSIRRVIDISGIEGVIDIDDDALDDARRLERRPPTAAQARRDPSWSCIR